MISHQRGSVLGSPLFTLALLVALGLLVAFALFQQRGPATPAAPPAALANPPPALGADERNTIAIYKRVSPSVVSVANKALVRAGFFGFQLYEVPQGAGSGFVWDREGRIISNYHVVHQADALTVTFSDGKTYDARLIGVAPDYDLAVLQIAAPAERLHPVTAGTSRDLQVGQSVLAIGNPFGLDATLTVGVISALGRSITAMTDRKIHDVIQTDAAINPGNSGGPLLDSSGRLIGVNTAILSPSGAYAGIGFAVPADTVARIVPQLIEKGHVSRAGLGVRLLPDHVAQRAGVSGVAVYDVPPDSPAAVAGVEGLARARNGDLLLGDVVVAIDKRPVTSVDDLLGILDRYQPGASVPVELSRNGQRRMVNLRLVEAP